MFKLVLTLLCSLSLAPVVYGLAIPFLFIVFLVNEFIRILLTKLLSLDKNNTIKFCDNGIDAVWEYRRPGAKRMVLASSLTKRGQLDNILNCVQHVEDRIFSSNDYDKLKHIVTKRFGYVCWRLDKKFSVKNHIRILNPDMEYTEQEHMKLLSELSDDMESGESKPQWEMIILPKYIDSNNEKRSCFIFRFQHAYMDGLSLLILLKKLGDDFSFTIDPLTYQVPLWKKLIFYSKSLILTPFATFQIFLTQFKTHWKLKSRYPGDKKIYTWTKLIDLQKLKIIKANTQASIPNIICLAFTEACKSVLPDDRLVKEFYITELLAFLPYPNSRPQNRYSVFSYGMSIENENTVSQKLKIISQDALAAAFGPCSLIYYYLMCFFGRLPCFIFSLMGKWVAYESFMLSNIPAPAKHFRFMDADCEDLMAFPPNGNLTGIVLASISYKGGIKICGQIDSSWLSDEECRKIFEQIPIIIENMVNSTTEERLMKFKMGDLAKKNVEDVLNNNKQIDDVIDKRKDETIASVILDSTSDWLNFVKNNVRERKRGVSNAATSFFRSLQ